MEIKQFEKAQDAFMALSAFFAISDAGRAGFHTVCTDLMTAAHKGTYALFAENGQIIGGVVWAEISPVIHEIELNGLRRATPMEWGTGEIKSIRMFHLYNADLHKYVEMLKLLISKNNGDNFFFVKQGRVVKFTYDVNIGNVRDAL